MSNRAPGTIWPLRMEPSAYVRTTDDDRIELVTYDGFRLVIDRADARLLARRINQCLDKTAKR